MLDYAHQRAREALTIPRTAVLATSGPAGIQVSEVACRARGLHLYLLVPKTSDHFFNLEKDPAVTLLSSAWELKGTAQVISANQSDQDLDLLLETLTDAAGAFAFQAECYLLIRVEPHQMQIRREAAPNKAAGKAPARWGNLETIDLKKP